MSDDIYCIKTMRATCMRWPTQFYFSYYSHQLFYDLFFACRLFGTNFRGTKQEHGTRTQKRIIFKYSVVSRPIFRFSLRTVPDIMRRVV
jgi:hypothetical protein